jgi:hypothetical protein
MKHSKILFALALGLLFSCGPAIKQFYPGTYFPEDRVYQNKALGFTMVFRGNWDIETDQKQMKIYTPYAAELHETGSEMLFMGFTVEKTQGTRCIATNFNEPCRQYAEEIQKANEKDLDSDSGLVDDTINNVPVTIWRYRSTEHEFVEYFFTINTYDLRIAFWTKPRLFWNFLPEYHEMMKTIVINGN